MNQLMRPRDSGNRVGAAGFEPAFSWSRSRRIARLSHAPSRPSAQRESNPHFRHGKAAGYRYIMGTLHRHRIVKESESTGWDSNPRRRITGAVSSPLDDRCTRTIRVGPEGLEPSPARLRAGCAAANTWVPASTTESVGSGGVEPPSPGYRPGALPLSYKPSPLRTSMGSEGLEP